MKFKFSHKTEELVDFRLYNQWQAPWRKGDRQRVGVYLPLSFELFAVVFILMGSAVLGVFLLVLAGLWMVFHERLMTQRFRQSAKGFFNNDVNEWYWVEHHYTFSTQGIHIGNENQNSMLKWHAVKNVMERPGAFWLFTSLDTAHIIPKRIMDYGEEMQFKRLLKRCLQ